MKKLLSLLALFLGVASTLWAYDFSALSPSGHTLYYNITGGVVSVSGGDLQTLITGNLIIPSSVYYNGTTYPVTSIGEGAFCNWSGLTSVTIPNSVTSIEWEAFMNCSGLTSVSIPNSVISIGGNAFEGCRGLTSVTIPNSVIVIGSYAFWGCSGLTSVTIPNSVITIGLCAFCFCHGMITTIPNTVNDIYEDAFFQVRHIEYHGNASGAPWGACSMNGVHDGDFVYSSSSHDTLIAYIGAGGNVTIPNSVTYIGSGAFIGCSSLASVTIPNSVTSIGGNAFYHLRHIEYHGTASGAPWGAYNMNGVHDGDFIYSSSSRDTLIAYIGAGGNVTIPNSVTRIERDAFKGCSGITSLTIPNSVTKIEGDAFKGCSGLTSLTIPESVTFIGSEAFYDCSSLTTVNFNAISCEAYPCFGPQLTTLNIGNSVSVIRDEVFKGCSGLTSVTIPNSVTRILWDAFYGCSGLKSVNIPNSVNYIGSNAFMEVRHIEYYGNASGAPWGAYSMNGVHDGDFIYSSSSHDTLIVYIGAGGNVTIPNSVTRIERDAFKGCSGITSLTIPNSVTSIGNQAFSQCGGLTTVNYNATDCITNGYPFGGCPISTVNIGANVTSIPDYLFALCDSVKVVNISDSVTTIGRYTFFGCDSLETATIGNSVRNIGVNAFGECGNLSSITFKSPMPPTTVEGAFFNVPSNIAVYIPCGTLALYMSRLPSTWNNYIENTFTFSAQSADDSMGTVQVLNEPTCTNPNAVIYAVPTTGFLFDHWSNGSTQNPYSLIVTTDTVITAFFVSESEPEGIDDINNDNIRIYSVDGNIVVVGAEDETVRVFDMTGRLVGTQSLPSGIYMVKVGTLPTRKVVVTR